MLSTIKRSNHKQTIFFVVAFVILGLFLFWKAPYGVIFNDEPFMIGLGHRFLNGDVLIAHDWNRAQTIGLFYIPFVWLYTQIMHSTEGLILFLRYIYVIWWLLAGAVLYLRLRKYGWISIVSVSCFLLFTPLDEMTLSYNALALSFLLLFFSYYLTEGKPVFDFINGIVLSAAVLAYPLLIFLFFVHLLCVIVFRFPKLKNTSLAALRVFNVKAFLRVCITAVILGMLVLACSMLCGTNAFLVGVREILTSNNKINRGVILLAKNYFSGFPVQMSLGVIVLLISVFDKKKYSHRPLYFSLQGIIFIITIILVMFDINYLNIIMCPVCFLGLQSYILLKKKDINMFVSLWCPGMIFALASYYSSDTGIMAIANGMAFSAPSSFMMIYQLYEEIKEQCGDEKKQITRACMVSLAVIIAFQLGGQLFLRTVRSYKDDFLPNLHSVVPCGAAKGIITTEENANSLESLHEDAQYIKSIAKGNTFLSITLNPVLYLEMDMKCSAYSLWTYEKDNSEVNRKLNKYYELHKNKIPDVIFSSFGYNHLNEVFDCVDFNSYQKYELNSGLWLVKR